MTINFYPTDNPGMQARKLNQLRDLVGEGGGGGGPVAWDDVTDKPSTFTPASHTQAISTIDGLQTALDAKAATSHSHAISDVSGLQTALDGKSSSSHSHAISDVTGLQTALDAKASTSSLSGYQPLDSDLTSIAELTTTTFGRSLLTLADAAALTASANAFTSSLKGLAPASGGGTATFLRADGNWAAPTVNQPSVSSQTSTSSLTPDLATYSIFRATALAANIGIQTPTGTPYDGQKIRFEFKDDGTLRNIGWTTAYRPGAALYPVETPGESDRYVIAEFTYSTDRSKWLCDASWTEVRWTGPIMLVGTDTYASAGTSGDHTVPLNALDGPFSAPVEGDLVIVGVSIAGSSNINVAASSSGWTEAADVYSDDAGDANLAVYYKVMGAVPDTSFAFGGFAAGCGAAAAVQVWRGVDTATPLDGVTVTTATGINGGNPNPPAIVPASANSKIIVVGAGAIDTTTSGSTFSTPSDLTCFITDVGADAYDGSIGMGARNGAASTSFDPGAWTGNTTNAAASWAAACLVLRPGTFN